MRKLLLFSILLFVASMVMAQGQRKFSVVGFEEKPFDTAANDARYKAEDGNGALFSIIKLVAKSPEDDLYAYTFSFGMCESRECSNAPTGERWIYVQRNAMHVTINRAGFRPVKEYSLKTAVQPGRVYEMVLSAEAMKLQKQMVLFKIIPESSNASIIFKSEENDAASHFYTINKSGEVQENLPLGVYTYSIHSEKYHSSEGRIILDNKEETYRETVTLRPKFSTIKLMAEPGVEIYVDDKKVGVGSWEGELIAGPYNVDCKKEYYKSNTEVINVGEGADKTIELKPLVPILGSLSIKTANISGATITIDGVDKGVTPKNIHDLQIGPREVVVSKNGYRSEKKTVYLEEGVEKEVVFELIKNPALKITSSVPGAKVTLNSVYKGVTPLELNDLLKGEYLIEVSLKGYNTETLYENVQDGESINRHVELKKELPRSSLAIASSPDGATIFIDGKNYGVTPKVVNDLIAGTHFVELTKDGYESKSRSIVTKDGKMAECNMELEKKDETGSLYITSIPSKAQVMVDNKKYGKVPCTVNGLSPGSHEIVLTKKGYHSTYRSAYVATGKTEYVNVPLQKKLKSAKQRTGDFFNVGLTASSGIYCEEVNEGEYEVSDFSGDFGLLMRMGAPTRHIFSFIFGAKVQYVSFGSVQAVVPFTLNWNWYRGDETGLYLGLGCSLGVELNSENYDYCGDFTINILGISGRHNDLNFYYKSLLTNYDALSTWGIAYTYYF